MYMNIHKKSYHLPPTIDEEEFQKCQEFNTDQDLEPSTDDLLDFITSQEHSDC